MIDNGIEKNNNRPYSPTSLHIMLMSQPKILIDP